jgi:hypothetical protein
VLLTGPFGGLTDDVREFLRCLADEGLPLTGWGDLDPASLRIVRERLPGGGALGDGPDGLALARRRTTLLRSPCDAGRLTETETGLLRLSPLGHEFLDLPDAAQLGFVFAAWWEGVDDPADWRQALWASALAPLAMLGALDVPARMSPFPAWFALTGTAPALLAAAAAMAGPEPPPSLAAADQN